MSLRFVIIGSFLCAFLCAAIVGVYALTRLNRSVETSAPIPSRFERFQALGQMEELSERMHSLAMESHFAGSQSERSAFQSANLAAHKEFSAAWTSIYRDSSDANEAELIRKLKYAWQHFLAIDEEVTAFDLAGEDSLALEILLHDFETGMTQFVGAAHDLQQFERDNVKRILLANVASSRTSAHEVLVVVIFSAGICGILAILLERFVAHPIQGLTEATLRLADGDLSVTVPDSRRTDQMGDLARAIQTFKLNAVNLQNLLEVHREQARLLRSEIEVRSRADAALMDSRQRLKRITDNLFEGVIVVNSDGRIEFTNPAAARLLEADRIDGGIEGILVDDLFTVTNAGGAVPFRESPWFSAITGQASLHDEDAVFTTRGGTSLQIAYSCSPVELGRAIVVSFRDISLFKTAQREALQASRLAVVGQLAAGIAHEINTPIQYIGNNLNFIGDQLPKIDLAIEAGRALASVARANADPDDALRGFEAAMEGGSLAALIEEMSNATLESLDGIGQVGRIVLSMKEFSHPGTGTKMLTDINRALVSTLTVTQNIWKHVVTVETEFDPALPSVVCHPGEVNQVFLNLIVNAAQAVEMSGKALPGRIALSTTARDGFVEIRIADSGTGIPETIKDRIFDPFFTTKEVGKGTGQGLAICRDVIVVKHGGRLDVAGREGEGAIFIVQLPIGDVDMASGGREDESSGA